MGKYCTGCGSELKPNTKYCGKCGKVIGNEYNTQFSPQINNPDTEKKIDKDNSGNETSYNITTSYQFNYKIVAIIASFFMAISIFLPWISLKGSSSSSIAALNMSFDYGSISGLLVGDAWIALGISIVSIILLVLKTKWVAICGILNLIIALGFIIGWRGYNPEISTSFNSEYGSYSAEAGLNAEIGVYILAISSIVLIVSNIKEIKQIIGSLKDITE